MDNLLLGRQYKASVLEEWREREEKSREEVAEAQRKAKITVRKVARTCYDMARMYLSGEFGEPTLRDKQAFLFSAVQGELSACRTWLLKFGSVEGAVDCQHELDGKTALTIAAGANEDDLVELLLQQNARTDVRDRFGCAALHYAASGEAFEAAALLLEAGADVDARDRQGVSALMRAAETGDADVVELLLDSAATPNVRDRVEKWTALHYAAKNGDEDCVVALLKSGCKYDVCSNPSRKTAQDIALDLANSEAAIVLGKWRRRKLFGPPKHGDEFDDLF